MLLHAVIAGPVLFTGLSPSGVPPSAAPMIVVVYAGPARAEPSLQQPPAPADKPLHAARKPPSSAPLASSRNERSGAYRAPAAPTREAARPVARAAREPLPAAADAEHAQPDDALRRWELAVLAQLDRHKRYPAAAQLNRQQDRVAVRIRVDRSGAVLSRRIVRSRGYPSLDGEALALIARADPLPAPPDGVDEHALDFSVQIDFEIATPRALN